ncbi:hypothetical protein [Microvirga aerophila]|jgi:preprotein translocase subunit SecG|nr:hypothetical protein [Microvirga aerophila]
MDDFDDEMPEPRSHPAQDALARASAWFGMLFALTLLLLAAIRIAI